MSSIEAQASSSQWRQGWRVDGCRWSTTPSFRERHHPKVVWLLNVAGTTKVRIRIVCSPTVRSCYYRVHMLRSIELISNKMEVEELRKFFGSDSLAASSTMRSIFVETTYEGLVQLHQSLRMISTHSFTHPLWSCEWCPCLFI